MIQLDMFNQPLSVARKNRGPDDMFPKGFSLPFKICFPASGGFVRELDGLIHAAGCGSEESRDGFNANTGAAQDRSVKRRIRCKSLAEFRGAIVSDDCNPVVSWCVLIHDGIPFALACEQAVRPKQLLCCSFAL